MARNGLGIFALALGMLVASVSYAQPVGKVFRIGVLSLGVPAAYFVRLIEH
jgi:hypothetical protein